MAGVTYDLTGSYATAIVLSAIFSLLGAASILVLETTKRILIPDWDRAMNDVSTESDGSAVVAGD